MIPMMVKLNSTIRISDIFSIIAVVGQIVAIWAIFKGRNDKSTDSHIESLEKEHQKELSIEKNFLKINMRMEEFGKNLNDISKNTDKSTEILNRMQTRIVKIDNILENHETRISKLEEKNSD